MSNWTSSRSRVLAGEIVAWRYLLALPRLDLEEHFWRICSQQIIIRACPGVLDARGGAPLLQVSVRVPGIERRITGSGNDLLTAVTRLDYYLRRAGAVLPPMPSLMPELLEVTVWTDKEEGRG